MKLKLKRWLKITITLVLVPLLLILTLALYVKIKEVPTDIELLHPNIAVASHLLDTKGREIGIYQKEFRIPVLYDEINPFLKDGLIAVEDSRFYEHGGVDFRAVLRVFFKTILMRDDRSGGGSTLSQQLAKQLYPRPKVASGNKMVKTFSLVKSKLREWFIAWKLEKLYTKDEILTMYLNKFEFINGAFGIEAAAQTYFGVHQNDLKPEESAVLIGMLKNPSLYNPVRSPNLVKARRNEVLSKIGTQEAVKLKETEMDLSRFSRIYEPDTLVPYFKNSLVKYLENLIKENNLVKADGNYYDVFRDDLIIESTIDLDIQKYAEKASLEHMEWLQSWLDKDWSKVKPWEKSDDEFSATIKQEVIERRAKASRRYQLMLSSILYPVLTRDLAFLTEDDIAWMVDKSENKSTLSYRDETKKKRLEEVMSSDHFPQIKEAWNRLQSRFKSEFETKIEMKVFDYKQESKIVEMTPMDSIKYHLMLWQTAVVGLNPQTGHVKCWNGGLDYNYFNLDHVYTRRSIGSTAKPFVYTLAMTEKDIKPCDTFKDTFYTIMPGEGDFKNKEPWQPENATKVNTTLMYNLYHGLRYSKNTITVRLIKELGSVKPLINLWDQMGIPKDETLPNGQLAVPDLPSIGLGAIDITLLQLTGAYATFARRGEYLEPILVKSIKTKDGHLIYESRPRPKKVIDPLYNAIMLDMLENNEKGEFSMHLKSKNGGKTGTTDNQCDGWYVGLTPELVVGVWSGGEEKWIHFIRDDVGQGYFTARPLFEKFIKYLEKDTTGIYNSEALFPYPPIGFKELTSCSKEKTEPLPEFVRKQLRQR